MRSGHDSRAAEIMSNTLRQSSIVLYETHWARFVEWCRAKGLSPFSVRSTQFCRYLVHLFDEGLVPSTIISHRTSIASVLRHWRYDPATDPQIRLLLRGFQIQRPRQRVIMPKWDLGLVLKSFYRPPYVSDPVPGSSADSSDPDDHMIDLKWRTIKTCFLLSLATARRRSYLHALSVGPGHLLFGRGNAQNQESVAFLPQAGFMAKNQLPHQVPQRVTVPGRRQQLFIHWSRAVRDIATSHISRWIVDAIRQAYLDEGIDTPSQVNAHELRALSASWAYTSHVALEDVLSACSWRSSGVFQGSYLRDMSVTSEGMFSLGPVVAAQRVTGARR